MKYSMADLHRLFPLGHIVINLGCIKAYIDGYKEHPDGSCDLVLREIVGGQRKRQKFTGDPDKCVLVN